MITRLIIVCARINSTRRQHIGKSCALSVCSPSAASLEYFLDSAALKFEHTYPNHLQSQKDAIMLPTDLNSTGSV